MAFTDTATSEFFGSWDRAWAQAATGPGGFWHSGTVAGHFRTASASALMAELISGLLRDLPEIGQVIEIGAGDGMLLGALHRLHPRLRLTGVDLRPNPTSDSGVDWLIGGWDALHQVWRSPDRAVETMLAQLDEPTMIICCEWLDELPCAVVSADRAGWREVGVRTDGREQVGAPAGAAAAQWLGTWWPEPQPGMRAEVGLLRDLAWSELITALRPHGGAAVMIDYGHRLGDRPLHGTLTAYANGRELAPRPDPAVNLTAHVAVDAVAAAGRTAGARTRRLARQADMVEQLTPPPADTSVLARLQEAGERRMLADALGQHWWLVQQVDAPRVRASRGAG